MPATEDDFLYAGNAVISIEAFGTIDITVKTPLGPADITLYDTALVPSFHTSVVSARKFKAKNVYWDMRNDRMEKNGKTVCFVKDHYDQ